MVSWPAIIHYEGDDELSYVENEHDWLNNEVFHRGLYNQGDQLVDSEGQVYSIDYNTATEKLLQALDLYFSNVDINEP